MTAANHWAYHWMKSTRLGKSITLIGILISGCTSNLKAEDHESLPTGFVYLKDIDSSIIQEMRYAGNHNFVGKPIVGYVAPKCILTREAAENLRNVQTELKQYSMSLKVYDCYRPQQSVDEFVMWAKNLSDTKMRKEFYPKVDKSSLFKDGYIAKKSGHSRGSTVDLTVVPVPVPNQATFSEGMKLTECYSPSEKRFNDNTLDFGTGFDCFDPLAHTSNPAISPQQKRNRLMLKSIMEKNGFKNIPVEWWHFTLKNEPYPETTFNFLVK